MKINILDSSVYNRISAGEVVENPASVVKELVENSIDAGAAAVTVKIEEGGIKLVEVIDNGAGIPEEELPKAILPHATSKIAAAEDLESISTLGFRGEALASIAAVSHFSIKTRYYESETGAMLRVGPSGVSVGSCAYNAGTAVTVRNLFYNTPARYKFLKTPRGEGNAVSAILSQLALSNPDVSIRFTMDGKEVFSTSGEGLFSAVKAVFGAEESEKMIALCDNGSAVKVGGFVGKPDFSYSNKSKQSIIVNGRTVIDAGISAAVQNAYGERLMHRNFPVFVLTVVLPFEDVDINVHPNKKEVRFANARQVYGAVYNTVKYNLELYEKGLFSFSKNECGEPPLSFHPPKEEIALTKDIERGKEGNREETEQKAADKTVEANLKKECAAEDYCQKAIKGSNRGATLEDFFTAFSMASPAVSRPRVSERYNEIMPPVTLLESDAVTPVSMPSGETKISDKDSTKINGSLPYQVIGQAFQTYLIVETDDTLLLIDQHAAHERLLYDELVRQTEQGEIVSQPLLLPYLYQSGAVETEILSELKEELHSLGFEVEEFGNNCIKVAAVPLLLQDIGLSLFIEDIIRQYKGGAVTLHGMAREKLMQSACKAAIKGGDSLTKEQIDAIVGYFIHNNIPLKCPHGRPAYIAYTKSELEKLFRRKI